MLFTIDTISERCDVDMLIESTVFVNNMSK